MLNPITYTQVDKFVHTGKTRKGKTYHKSFTDHGTLIHMGLQTDHWHTSQIASGKVVESSRITLDGKTYILGSAEIVTGKGKSKVTHRFGVYRTESTQWAPIGKVTL